MEVATGRFPYPKWGSVFEQLFQVVEGEAPRLSTSSNGMEFSDEFVDFVNTWCVSMVIMQVNLLIFYCCFQFNKR
jgi:hypothetical protein